MKKFLVTAVAGVAAAIAFASPANAARTLCTSGPVINLVTQPCVWSPGPPGNDDEASVELAIFEATGVNVNLSLFGKSDSNAALFTFSSGPNGVSSTNWTINSGALVQYVTVKGANEFKVYQLAGAGASSGNATSADLLNNGGNQPNISHISFWTAAAAVPEPGTWALLILGFGAVGGVLRSARRRRPALNYI